MTDRSSRNNRVSEREKLRLWWKYRSKLLGRLGVWLCNRYYPRPTTFSENCQSQQYVRLMIEVLRGEVEFYGRDCAEDHVPIVAERRDYAKLYGEVAAK